VVPRRNLLDRVAGLGANVAVVKALADPLYLWSFRMALAMRRQAGIGAIEAMNLVERG
jgi:hypothetical protein